MAWVAVGSMALGAVQGHQKQKREAQDNAMQAELMKYGMKPDFKSSSASAQSGAMQGLGTGVSMYQNLNQAGLLGGSDSNASNNIIPVSNQSTPTQNPMGMSLSNYSQDPHGLSAYSNLNYKLK